MFVYIATLGCKVNQYESQVIMASLSRAGYKITFDSSKADIFIINSCSVTANSDRKTRSLCHRFKRENPDGIIVLTGCMTQAAADTNSLPEEADIILGNTSRGEIVPLLRRYLYERQKIVKIDKHRLGDTFEPMTIDRFEGRTRAFVKIEDGCDCYCTYCIIPYARGHIRSKSLEDIEKEVLSLSENGYTEIVLVGINLSCYGRDLGCTLIDAVRAAAKAPGIKRVRLGSLEPDLMTETLIEGLAAEEKLCPQFHISLQSGCDRTLGRMNRKYKSEDYMRLVTALRENFADCSITTDIMVGFAGETEEEFSESLAFAKEVGFARTHVFAYSRRKGTAADRLPGQITNAVKEERSRIMTRCGEESQNKFMQSQVGRVYPVLIEQPVRDGMLEGYTPNYTKVYINADPALRGKIVNVKIISAQLDHCTGEITEE
ncbi:MAG: tRNA (N(6)-L-threonylcarbamoyladenosine(37)-C(2))-methylthiotransferase MtaB [Clostridia bacterium]|nr:tRNA (N(6)-L-threonylcarbamoyladenosine(37)-C(2))-methylthiotransferase MtaB [Clostridia bacterium]